MSDFMQQYKRAGRNDLPALLIQAWWAGEIDDDKIRDELPHAYNAAEWPCRYINIEVWMDVLGTLEWVGDLDRPTEPMTVYRAQVGSSPGLSWSPDRKTAEWFQKRNESFSFDIEGDEIRIIEHVAQPEHVLGMFTGREGIELLIDPYEIDDFELAYG